MTAAGARLMGGLARLLVGLFYRRVEVVGLEHVPSAGPLVVTANHQNALVDPMLLLAVLPRALRPLAKAPLFRHPMIGPFLRLAGAIPVHRRQDSGSDPARNAEMFRVAAAALRAGQALVVFPEGVSQPEPLLMPLRTGVARIVLGAETGVGVARGASEVSRVTLLPVGLVFHEPGTFRDGWALVVVGPPVATADCLTLAAGAPEDAVRRLTARLTEALRALIVEVEDRHTLQLIRAVESIWRVESPAESPPDMATRAAWTQQAARAARWLETQEPSRLARLRRDVERYVADLEGLGLADRQLTAAYPPSVVARYALREAASLMISLPLAAWGIVSHVLPYQLTGLATRLYRPDADALATVKLSAALVFYPLAWLVEGWAVWRVGGGLLLAAFLVGLLPGGLVALTWRERLGRVRREARGFFRFLVDRDVLTRLRARRRGIMDELAALADRVPASVRAGEVAPPPA